MASRKNAQEYPIQVLREKLRRQASQQAGTYCKNQGARAAKALPRGLCFIVRGTEFAPKPATPAGKHRGNQNGEESYDRC